jgi:hypothetical protein
MRRFDFLVEAVRRAGPRKVLFGTDGPWLHPALELEKVCLLGLEREAEELVLGGSFMRLVGRVRKIPSAVAAFTRPAIPRGFHDDPWLTSRQ